MSNTAAESRTRPRGQVGVVAVPLGREYQPSWGKVVPWTSFSADNAPSKSRPALTIMTRFLSDIVALTLNSVWLVGLSNRRHNIPAGINSASFECFHPALYMKRKFMQTLYRRKFTIHYYLNRKVCSFDVFANFDEVENALWKQSVKPDNAKHGVLLRNFLNFLIMCVKKFIEV